MAFVRVGVSEDVPEGEARAFEVDGVEVAVARDGGACYALNDICSHRRCNLAMGGEVEDGGIVCECHGSVFDLRTGAALNPPATEPIAVYAVREVDGSIEVDVTAEA
jgi:nitrite reductase/ring-hydroxylating ferredoxin subunit